MATSRKSPNRKQIREMERQAVAHFLALLDERQTKRQKRSQQRYDEFVTRFFAIVHAARTEHGASFSRISTLLSVQYDYTISPKTLSRYYNRAMKELDVE